MINSYRDLDAWQLSMQLAEQVYRLTRALPNSEMFGLASQMQRAAVSVPSNIAEGHARTTTRDYLRFLSIALASLAELETQLLLTHRIHALPIDEALVLADTTGRKLRGLQKSLSKKLATVSKKAS